MSTHGYIGYRDEKGNIKATYNHYDSDPVALGQDADIYIKDNGIEKFVRLIDCASIHGGFRCFPNEMFDNNEDFTVTNRKDFNDLNYVYIYDKKTGKLVEFYKAGELIKENKAMKFRIKV
jgi:hypothetical protein